VNTPRCALPVLLPDEALLIAAGRGSPDARRTLVLTWGPVVLRWCARLGGPGIDPDDAAHDVFVIVLERVGALRDPRAFPCWLYHVTRSVVARYRRSGWFRRVILGALPDAADEATSAQVRLERDEEARDVLSVLEGLSADFREILVLCEMESRPEAEVAALLKIPVGTVKSRLHRARGAFARKAQARGLASATTWDVDPTLEGTR